jgi:hypothetical protein
MMLSGASRWESFSDQSAMQSSQYQPQVCVHAEPYLQVAVRFSELPLQAVAVESLCGNFLQKMLLLPLPNLQAANNHPRN